MWEVDDTSVLNVDLIINNFLSKEIQPQSVVNFCFLKAFQRFNMQQDTLTLETENDTG